MSKLFVTGKIVKLFVICTQISYELEYYTLLQLQNNIQML